MIEVIVQDESGSRNIIFSGDIGQWNNPLLGNPSVFDRADYVVMESTYGDRNHENPQDIDERLSKIVNNSVNEGGNVLIPTFAIERAQELLYHFNRLAQAEKIPYIMTFLGGADFKPGDQTYIDAYTTAKYLAQMDLTIYNCGGPGVMRASTEGAKSVGGKVIGVTYHPNVPHSHFEGRDPLNNFDQEIETSDYFERKFFSNSLKTAHLGDPAFNDSLIEYWMGHSLSRTQGAYTAPSIEDQLRLYILAEPRLNPYSSQ